MGLFDIFTNKNAQDAANIQTQGAQKAYGDLSDLYGKAGGAITSNFTSALQPFLQNLKTGQQGTSAYADATGVNGPDGNTRATTAFWNNPAIQSQLDIGDQNILRNQAASGQLASGKTNVDLQQFGQQTASQGWDKYLASLTPFLNLNQGAAAGAGNIYTGMGTSLAGLDTGQASAAYGADTSSANAQANAALANNAGSANLWGLLGNVGKLGVSGAGGGGGTLGGNLISGLGSAFMGMFSDERLKDDIAPVGNLYDGQRVYSYRYKGDDTPRIGLMAQEVERVRPDAVTEIGGFKAVDYGRATDYASKLARFLEAA